MSWITPAESDLVARLSGPELAAYRSAALKSGQGDPLAQVLSGVVGEVRGYVAGNKSNQLGAGATIPSELLDAAMALVVLRLATRLPINLTDARKTSAADAQTLLRRVADGSFYVSSAATPDPEQAASLPSFDRKPLNFTRADHEGIGST